MKDDGSAFANLRAPVVINPAQMVGYQVVPQDSLYPLRTRSPWTDVMLVFSRRRGEAVVVGDGIEIVVFSSGKEGVASASARRCRCAVHRKEIYEQICEENRQAAGALGAAPPASRRLRRAASSRRGGAVGDLHRLARRGARRSRASLRGRARRWIADLAWDPTELFATVEQGRVAGHVAGWIACDRERVTGWTFYILHDNVLQMGPWSGSGPR